MAYSVVSTKGPTELAAVYKVVAKIISPDAATGSITFSEFDTVDQVLGFGFSDDADANCYTISAKVNGSTANQVDFKLWKAGGTAADTTFVDFFVTVLAH